MKDVTLAILAGGEGARMGRPKGMLTIENHPVLEFLLARFGWRGPTMLVTAPGREHPPGWEHFDREVTDPVASLGPLRGILTALENAQTDLIVVATVDMPSVTSVQLVWLASHLQHNVERKGLMMTRRESSSEIIEPFPSTFRKNACDILRARLDRNLRSVHSLADEPGIEIIASPADWPAPIWTNLNHPATTKLSSTTLFNK